MSAMNRPHFLRVVQALSLVSGFGSVAIVAGTSLVACSSSTSPTSPPVDSGSDAFTGIVTGTQPACTLDEAGTCTDAAVAITGIQVAPDASTDAGPDAVAVGGPLSPPELRV
jgi:hypothetical protein